MPSISEKLTINLNIAGKYYPITIKREQEEAYRKAARLATQKFNNYTTNFKTQDNTDYYAMTMLDLALTIVKEENIDNRLHEILEKLDKTI